jgi:regulator of replication initiation timing
LSITENVEDLKALIVLLFSEIESLKNKNAFLEKENAELRSRLGMNSENSSKPPSSDGYKKKPALGKEKGKN